MSISKSVNNFSEKNIHMKKLNHIIIALTLVSMLGLGLNSCKNPLEGFKATVSGDIFKTTAAVRIKDAKTNGLMFSDNINISVKGAIADHIYSIEGNKLISVKNGVFAFALDPSLTPSAAHPVRFTAVLRANGYLDKEVVLELKNEGQLSFDVSMVNITNPPKEVTIILNSGG